MTTGSISGRQS